VESCVEIDNLQIEVIHVIKIKNEDLIRDCIGGITNFPKYTSQLINLANQNAQGTRPKVVGQMSDLIQEFPGNSYQEWVEWYKRKNPNAISDATDKIYEMIGNLKSAIQIIDKNLIQQWVDDLVITKTYVGFRFQESILKKIAAQKGQKYRLATPEEESSGIDGYIGDIPISIKPITYKTKNMLSEKINVKIIFYEKTKDGLKLTY
jgi:hypothetical protein